MIKCGTCGAQNLPSAKFCQMCAMSLSPEGTENASANRTPGTSLSSTVVFSVDPPDKLICSVCEASNDGDWIFCQQCGSKLGSTPVPASPIESEAAPKEEPSFSTTIQASQLAPKPKQTGGIACPKCLEPLVGDAAFCHKCGAVTSNARTVAMSSFKPAPKARLMLIVDGEATGDEFEIKGDTIVGRVDGDITFPHDDYMSGRHASIRRNGDKFVLIDEDSRNGSFVRIKKQVELKPGDFILLGKQLFRFEM
jgi:ribosomal protein L40E